MKHLAFAFLILMTAASSLDAMEFSSLAPIQESEAYRNFLKRSSSELSKLIYLMDRFQGSELLVVYNRRAYEMREAVTYVKQYMQKHYKGREKAERWIKIHSYRSPEGEVIYFQLPDGKRKVVRDELLDELRTLHKILSEQKK